MKSKLSPVLLLLTLVAALAFVAFKQAIPSGIALKGFDPQAIAGVLTWLFTVALFIERAVEVVIMVLRDADADHLESVVETELARIADMKTNDITAPAATPALALAKKNLSDYRAATKQIALVISLVLGLLISLAGVRALDSIVAAPGSHGLYIAVDVFVTGAVLAGGSEGVHQMANVVSNFLQSTADKARK